MTLETTRMLWNPELSVVSKFKCSFTPFAFFLCLSPYALNTFTFVFYITPTHPPKVSSTILLWKALSDSTGWVRGSCPSNSIPHISVGTIILESICPTVSDLRAKNAHTFSSFISLLWHSACYFMSIQRMAIELNQRAESKTFQKRSEEKANIP